MKNINIAKIRQNIQIVREMVKCPHTKHIDKCDFCKRTKLLDEALTLLPCETCNGARIVPNKFSYHKDFPCPDCQKKPIDK